MEKKRILFFMDGVGNAGGIQEMVINWVKHFCKDEFIVDILSYNTGKQDNYIERFEEISGKVYIIDTFTKGRKFFRSLKQTKEFFDNNKYDIVHAHASSKAFFVLREAKRHNIKIRILHSHCTQFINKSLISKFIGYALKPFATRVSTHYMACSHEAGYFLFGKKRMDKKGIIIPNGIELSKFSYNPEISNQKKLELHLKNEIIIGNVGRFRPQKNHIKLLNVFKVLHSIEPNSKLVLVGNGELMEMVKNKIKEYNLTDSVLLLGFRSDVNDIVQTFDVLVMPSFFEGLPVTSIEAQAVGVPCVFSENISKDAAVIPNCHFVSLHQNDEVWAKVILEVSKHQKTTNSREIMYTKGFDICQSSLMLTNYYKVFLNGKKSRSED